MFYIGKDTNNSGKPKTKCSTLWLFWLVLLLLLFFATVAVCYLFYVSQSDMVVVNLLDDDSELRSIADEFARTVTRQDWKANAELFVAGSKIDFHRAFTFLTDYPPLSTNNDLLIDTTMPIGSWGQQLAVFAGGLSSNHLIINNCNISYGSNTANIDCILIYTYTLAYSTSFFTNNFPTQLIFFQSRFDAIKTTLQGWRFTHALALINATNTLLSSVETGVAPPGAVITKRYNSEGIVPSFHYLSNRNEKKKNNLYKKDALSDWNTIQYQINSLVNRGQVDTAKAICRTEQYITLASTFDPYQNDTAFMCNTIMRLPVTLDSPMTCGPNGSINASCLVGPIPGGGGGGNGILTINSITPIPPVPVMPNSQDFTITGGFGISIQGDMHGITIHNVGLTAIPLVGTPELDFIVTSFPIPMLTVVKLNQTAATVWAGPVSGSPAPPTFRLLQLSDLPLINLASHVSGVLPIIHGGTNSATPLVGNRIMVSTTSGGGQIVESSPLPTGYFLTMNASGTLVPGTLIPGTGINISFVNGSYVISDVDIATMAVTSVGLAVPSDLFVVSGSPITSTGTLTFTKVVQSANTVWAGPTSGPAAVPAFRLLEASDLPLLNLTTAILPGSVLPISHGGTNNAGPFAANAMIVMDPTGTFMEDALLVQGGGIIISHPPGSFVFSTNVTLQVPSAIFIVTSPSGNMLSFGLSTQVANTVWAGPTSGGPTVPGFRALVAADLPSISLTSGVTGVLPLANGGTNNAGPYTGQRIIMSNTAGTALVTGTAQGHNGITVSTSAGPQLDVTLSSSLSLTSLTITGSLVLTNTTTTTCGAPLTGACLDISGQTCPGGFLSNDCMYPAPTLNGLTVYGPTFLGNSTSCTAPLSGSCYDISNQACPGGYLDNSCINPDLALNTVTIQNLLVYNLTSVNSTTLNLIQSFQNLFQTDMLLVQNITLNGLMTCQPPNGAISQSCIDISSITCTAPVDPSCLGSTAAFTDLTVTNDLTINNLICIGSPIPDDCLPIRIETINGIGPTPSPGLDFSMVAGTGIFITGIANGILIDNTGVTSVDLDLPASLFNISGSPVTTTGTLTASLIDQSAHTFFAAPIGMAGVPSFRAMVFGDLPATGTPDTLYFINASGYLTQAPLSLGLSVPSGEFSVSGSPITNPAGSFVVTKQVQSPHRVWAGPSSGLSSAQPTFRSLVFADLPNGGSPNSIYFINGSGILEQAALSLSLVVPSAEFAISGSPITDPTGTFTLTKQTQVPHSFWAGPSAGPSAAQPTFRTLVLDDLAVFNLTNGQLLMGSPSGAPQVVSLVAGPNINITYSPGQVEIAAIDTYGTVTSVDLALPVSVFSTSGGPVTVSGTLTGSFVSQTAATVFAAPALTSGTPSFRLLVDTDLPYLPEDGIFIGGAGGGVTTSILVAGSGISIVTSGGNTTISTVGVVTSVALALPGSVFSISGSPVTSTGTLTGAFISQSANYIFAAPSGSSGVPSFRAMTLADLPPLTNGQIYIGITGMAPIATQLTAGALITVTPGPGTSTISTSALGMVTLTMPGVFSVSSSSGPNTQTLTVALNTQSVNKVWAGPAAGPAALPTFRALVAADIPNLSASQITSGILPIERGGTNSGTSLTNGKIMVSSGGAIVEGTLSDTPTFVSETLSATSNQLTLGKTFTATISATQPAASRTYTIPDPDADANFVMNTASALTITNAGSIGEVLTLATATTATWQAVTGTGTVTSVDLSMPSIFSVSGSPVTTTGTLTATLVTQSANTVWAGPTSGPVATPTFRALVAGDIPLLDVSKISTGILPIARGGTNSGTALINGKLMISSGGAIVEGTSSSSPIFVSETLTAVSNQLTLGTTNTATISATAPAASRTYTIADPGASANFVMDTAGALTITNAGTIGQVLKLASATTATWQAGGTVTSVALSLPGSVFSVSGSPVTSTGTLTGAFVAQNANFVFAGPTAAPAAMPAFRALVAADVPSIDASKITTGILPIARGGTNSGTALSNNRIMVSSAGAIVEAAALTNGQLLIGSTGAAPVAAALTGTANQVIVTNGAGSITLSTPQNIHTAATPTFASETLSAVSNQLTLGTTNTATISATAPAASRTYTIADPGASANFVMDTAGALTITNLPTAGQSLIALTSTTAQWASSANATGSVLSVGLALPVSVFTVSGSPVTGSGTLTGTFNTQSTNTFFAGPTSGAAATPTFRTMVASDLPANAYSVGDSFNASPTNGTVLSLTVVSGKKYLLMVQSFATKSGGSVQADIYYDCSSGATSTWGLITQVARQNYMLATGELYVFSGWTVVTATSTTVSCTLRTDSTIASGLLIMSNYGLTGSLIG